MSDILNGYDLSRGWFDFCFENPEKINPNHSAIFFFAIEHCNRLGWKEKFGFPTQMVMDAVGIKRNQTYIKYFDDLCEWGFFILIEKSINQYSANIIKLSVACTKNRKALDKAFVRHASKHSDSNRLGNRESNRESTCESNRTINKPINKEQLTNKPLEEEEKETDDNFQIIVQLKPIKNLHAFVKQTFPKTEETLQMKVGKPAYLERQEAFILRHNERSYTNDNDFLNHYRNFILTTPPPEKQTYNQKPETRTNILPKSNYARR